MPNATDMQLRDCIGEQLLGTDGGKIGKIADVYVDEQTNRPEWFAVTTGIFGNNVSFVPIARATVHEGNITVPYTKADVKDAPNAEPDARLSQEEEARLYAHYD